MNELLVLGIGNPLQGDDGVGIKAVELLGAEDWPEGVVFVDGGTSSYDMIPYFRQSRRALILDAVKGSHPPGTLYRLEPEDLSRPDSGAWSVHDLSFVDALNLAEMSGSRPSVVRIIGCQPAVVDWVEGFSEPVAAVFDKFLEAARREIKALLETPVAG